MQCTSPIEAINIEKQIKGWTKRKKDALINENWQDLILFSKNYTEFGNPYMRDQSSTGSDWHSGNQLSFEIEIEL